MQVLRDKGKPAAAAECDISIQPAAAEDEAETERMSCSKWAYEPEYCDGEPCPGNCYLCEKAQENEARRQEKEEIRTCAGCLYWNYSMIESPCRDCRQGRELTCWEPDVPKAAPEMQMVESNIFNIEEIHTDCTVQILRNSVTGEQSFAWYPNDRPPRVITSEEE